MSYFENFLKANQAYVELHGDLHLPIKPKTQVAIVTCMDSRPVSYTHLDVYKRQAVMRVISRTMVSSA